MHIALFALHYLLEFTNDILRKNAFKSTFVMCLKRETISRCKLKPKLLVGKNCSFFCSEQHIFQENHNRLKTFRVMSKFMGN